MLDSSINGPDAWGNALAGPFVENEKGPPRSEALVLPYEDRTKRNKVIVDDYRPLIDDILIVVLP